MCNHPPESDSPSEPWNIRTGMRIWFGGNNVAVRRLVTPLLIGTLRPTEGPLDAAVVTPLTWDEAAYFLEKLAPRLVPNSTAWIVEPSANTLPTLPARDADPASKAIGFSRVATGSPDPRLVAHGYRRQTS